MKRQIFQVLTANIVELIIGIVVTFFVPLTVSIANYSEIKTYTLYVGYIGLLSLGFYDGIYIKYGGRTLKHLNSANVRKEQKTFLLLEIFLSLITLCIGLISKNILLIIFSISILPINLFTYFKRLYQSIGEFKFYRNGMLVYSLSYMILNVILAVILRVDSVLPYCLSSVFSSIFACIYSQIVYSKVFKLTDKTICSKPHFLNIVNKGYLILLGNLAVSTIYSLDRWFVKILYNTADFAYYSFAVSLLNIVMVLIQSVAITLYNYFAANRDMKKAKDTNSLIICLGGLASAGYFFINIIITTFITNYVSSLEIIAISFASYPYMIAINSVFLNLYKAEKRDKDYMKSIIFMLSVSITLNILSMIFNKVYAIAYATTFSFMIWYYFCQKDFKNKLKSSYENVYLFILFITFIISTHCFNNLVGLIIYLLVWLFITIIYLKKNKIRIQFN